MAQNKASTKRASTTATCKTSKGTQKKVAPQYQNSQVVASELFSYSICSVLTLTSSLLGTPANAPVTEIQPTAMNDVAMNGSAVGIAKGKFESTSFYTIVTFFLR